VNVYRGLLIRNEIANQLHLDLGWTCNVQLRKFCPQGVG
jgi:hypothetical protein